MNDSAWGRSGEDLKTPIRYVAGGLSVMLLNGYDLVEDEDGEEPDLIVHDLDGLHRAIAKHLATKKKVLAGGEIRYLRKFLELTQAELADKMGCDSQTIARYEKETTEMPGPAERLLRILVDFQIEIEGVTLGQLQQLLDDLNDMDSDADDDVSFEMSDEGWLEAA